MTTEKREGTAGPEERRAEVGVGKEGMMQSEPARQDEFPADLLKGMGFGRGVLFIGPGVSRAAGLTLREELDQAFRRALRHQVPLSETADLEAFLEVAGPAEVAQAVRDQLGTDRYLKFLDAHARLRDVPPPSILYALRALPFQVIMTTNIDRVIERVMEHPLEDQVDADVVIPVPGSDDVPDPEGRPVLVKLFGDPRTPESLVLTTDDYETFFRKRPQLVARLKVLLELGPALFVGFDLREPEFLRLYSMVGPMVTRANRRAYAVLARASTFERRWWARRALTILAPDDHRGEEYMVRQLHQRFQALVFPEVEFEPDPLLMTTPLKPVSPWNLAPLLLKQFEQCKQDLLDPANGDALEKDYIPQLLNPEGSPEQSREHRLGALLATSDPAESAQLTHPAAVDPVVALQRHSRILVHAPSGAGKTMLLLHILEQRTRAAVDVGERSLVVYLPLRRIPEHPDRQLMELIVDWLGELAGPETEPDVGNGVMDACLEGRALLLLDGLDEVAREHESLIWERLGGLLEDCPKVRVVVTCRSSSLAPERLPSELGLTVFELCPLTLDQQYAFIRKRLKDRPFAPQLLTALLRAGVAPWAMRLASNPLHLSLLCLQFLKDNAFPETRAGLYDAFMGIVLRRQAPGRENLLYAYDKELILQRLALVMMTEPERSLDEDRVLQLAGQEMDRAKIAPRRNVSVEILPSEALEEIIRQSGLLVRSGAGRTYRFRLTAFKEYLAAKRLLLLDKEERDELIVSHAADRRWAGVWRLHAALTDDATPLLEQLDAHLGEDRRPLVRVFGDARHVDVSWLKSRVLSHGDSRELGELLGRLRRQVSADEKLEICTEVLWQDQERFMKEGRRSDARALYVALSELHRISARERDTAHRASEAIANWRGTADTGGNGEAWPCHMVSVPGGRFLMGAPDSGAARYVEVPDFEIARTPLTVDQYRVFDPSYDVQRWERRKSFAKGDHPAVHVSWYDAWVCAEWFACRLPEEHEWEKAASWDPDGEVKRLYPWGDEWDAARCNSRETWRSAGHTTAVARFGDKGGSPYGCWDMAGNVLEWTATRGEGTLERRVLKGGNWQSSPLAVQPARAVWLRPGFTGSGVGFRLARTPSPPLEDHATQD